MELYLCDNCGNFYDDFSFHVIVIYDGGLRRDLHYHNLPCKHEGLKTIRQLHNRGQVTEYHINPRIGSTRPPQLIEVKR